jgi:hypothetical protein
VVIPPRQKPPEPLVRQVVRQSDTTPHRVEPTLFALEDLFVVGIGFDIGGAWLLARGLLAGPAEIALRTASLWDGNPATTASQLEDRLNGTLGVGSLILGFSLQAVAYGIVVGQDDPSGGNWIGVAISAVAPIACVASV